MDEALLSYYNRELAYLRQQGAAFAERHPKIAGRLRLDRDNVEDPHVSRLLEGFAFLTARIRQKLDDSFPELTEALMGVLYPDYHAPVPSLTVAQIYLLRERLEVRHVPAGTLIVTRDHPRGPCFYRSCYDTVIYPLQVESAQFAAQPFKAPPLPTAARPLPTSGNSTNGNATPLPNRSQAVLRIALRAERGSRLSELKPPSLRFFLNGQPQLSFRLYEWLLQHATAIALARDAADPAPRFLPPTALRARGFDEADAALPSDGRTGTAHRLLTEYNAFPEKFLFVELEGLAECWDDYGESATLYVYFDRSHPELTQGVGATSLLLGCAPFVNLYERNLASFLGRDVGYERQLVTDRHGESSEEIHSILHLHALDSDRNRRTLLPFYGHHRQPAAEAGEPLYWHTRREPSTWHNGHPSLGTDTFVTFVDREFAVTHPQRDWMIGGRVLCTNRDLPDQLPFGPDQPNFDFEHGGAGLRIRCITPPTPTLHPALREATRWQLATQLSLQHLDGPHGLQTLKALLRLYDFRQLPESRAISDGIASLAARPSTLRIARGGRSAFCQGTCIELELDEQFYSDAGLHLFCTVLSEVLAHFCTINTFVQLSVRLRQRPGSVITWPPRSGYQSLI